MRQEFSRGKPIHEILVYVQLHVGDAVADLIDPIEAPGIFQHPRGTSQRAVAQAVIACKGKVRDHADGDRGCGVDKGSEGTGDEKRFKILWLQPHAAGDGFQYRVHGRFGADQAVQVRLGDTKGCTRGRLIGGYDGQVCQAVIYGQSIPAAFGQ